MAASISASTVREALSRQLEDLLRSGQHEDLRAVVENQLMSFPDVRELRLYHLFVVIKAEGVGAHEGQIEALRNLTGLTDGEREVIRQIFILGFEQAQKEGTKEKAWAYQRLARKLVLRQSLLGPLPTVETRNAAEATEGKKDADASSKSFAKSATGLSANGKAFKKNHVGSALLVIAGVGIAAILINYAPRVWNQARSRWAEGKNPSNGKPVGRVGLADLSTEGTGTPATGSESPSPDFAANERGSPTPMPIKQQVANTPKIDEEVPPLPHKEAKISPTKTDRSKKKNAAAIPADIRIVEDKVRKELPVSHPREKPAIDVTPDRRGDEAKEGAFGTYQIRVDVRLRAEPRFGSPSGIKIEKGTLISALDLNGDWLRIRVLSDGTTGFVRKEFVVPVSATGPK
jgi:hypothetical protein